ncbi:hypothetical protein [Tenggerimyces flavus]|uniref:Uncharacterized protein n=1 Tax=Tenggerimyces flavus TaxID=1708749 RepID=A0ABV7YFL7_9ACTN|nr:hypothetical protein [Tenggerimyces flavus]MBM7783403.1 hypothetical protein [Tenggerimyces flavus]
MKDSKLSQRNRKVTLATLAIGLAFVAAACGGQQPQAQGVASLGDTPSPTASSESKASGGKDGGLKYAQCMRENGIDEFPDPEGGKLTLKAKPGSKLDPNSPAWKKAEEACKSLRPEPSEGQKQQMKAQGLEYAQCMRENGIKEFPDPNPDGGMLLRMKKGTDLDPESPKFKKAQEACKSLMPGGAKGGAGETNVEEG